tara:strand:+ start:54 stop:281 length:228 start_codon:yes stop_codon:yes gene_type:complete
MKVTKEQAKIILTALQNHSAEAYINGNNDEMLESQDIIKTIEEEMNSDAVDVGSETGIERDYYNQGKPDCEVCDD